MATQYLPYSLNKGDFHFLMINILKHDPSHDYASLDDRWENSVPYLNKLLNSTFTMSGGRDPLFKKGLNVAKTRETRFTENLKRGKQGKENQLALKRGLVAESNEYEIDETIAVNNLFNEIQEIIYTNIIFNIIDLVFTRLVLREEFLQIINLYEIQTNTKVDFSKITPPAILSQIVNNIRLNGSGTQQETNIKNRIDTILFQYYSLSYDATTGQYVQLVDPYYTIFFKIFNNDFDFDLSKGKVLASQETQHFVKKMYESLEFYADKSFNNPLNNNFTDTKGVEFKHVILPLTNLSNGANYGWVFNELCDFIIYFLDITPYIIMSIYNNISIVDSLNIVTPSPQQSAYSFGQQSPQYAFVQQSPFVFNQQSPFKFRQQVVGVQVGGVVIKDSDLTIDQLTNLIGDFNQYLVELQQLQQSDDLFKNLDSIYRKPDNRTPENIEYYNKNRQQILETIQKILRTYEQLQKENSINTAIVNEKILPNLTKRSLGKNAPTDLYTFFVNSYTVQFIEHYASLLNKANNDALAQELLDKKNADKAAAGKLTNEHKKIRSQFSSLLAKLALALNGLYDVFGQIITTQNIDRTNYILMLEESLSAGWAGFAIPPNAINKYNSIAKTNMDTILFDETKKIFKAYLIEENNYPICKNNGGQYVIDNAAMLSNGLKSLVYCPLSSIADGMKKCNYNLLSEFGNMDFTIIGTEDNGKTYKNDHYYNGKCIIGNAPEVTYELNLKFPIYTDPIKIQKNINLKGDDLEAPVVLKYTFSLIIEYIISTNGIVIDSNGTTLFNKFTEYTGKGIFENIYDVLFLNTAAGQSDRFPPLIDLQRKFLTIFYNILFKGTGDLFQEINAVAKFGGYSKLNSNYNAEPNTCIPVTHSGDTLRMFLANDQPSACRFAFMLLRGYPEYINLLAFGGYMGNFKEMIITRAKLNNKQFKQLICITDVKNATQSNYHNVPVTFSTDTNPLGGKKTKKNNKRFNKKSNKRYNKKSNKRYNKKSNKRYNKR